MMPSSVLDSRMVALTILVLLDQYVSVVQGMLRTHHFVFAGSADAREKLPDSSALAAWMS